MLTLTLTAPLPLAPGPPTDAEPQMTEFLRFCEETTGHRFHHHEAFHRFSVKQFRSFWSLFLRWSGALHEGSISPVCTDDDCERATFFPELRLSYAENLLRLDGELHGDRPAITSLDVHGHRECLTRRELSARVSALAAALHDLGVTPGDHVVLVAHNDAAAVVAALAAVTLGATLSTASPDMGAFSILARFAPLQPTLLMCHLDASDPDSAAQLQARVAEIVQGLPSLKAVVTLDAAPLTAHLGLPVHRLAELLDRAPSSAPPRWQRFPFNHPLFVLFSSGTTGKPKCIIHGAGGTLLEHLKEHRLHGDLRPGDRLFFHTSCSWMMWNWQLSALASGAEIFLFAGPIRAADTLWRLVADELITAFGTSPAYLQLCQDAGFSPARELPIGALRVLMSTGSILHDHQYDWVNQHVGPVPLQSISGGTDIIGCFALGNPCLPVVRGECQCRSLGMDVRAVTPDGQAPDSAIGELVCCNPFPSRPLGFHGDLDGTRFHQAYFAQHKGAWTHGDLIEISPFGGLRLHGRSDGVLNVNGMRVGPAEIYRILHAIPEIVEGLAVEQHPPAHPEQSRLLLLVVLRPDIALDGPLKRRIRKELASRGSPAHVPGLILAVPELPTTHSGKRSERAARDAADGVEVVNLAAIRNPSSLVAIRRALSDSGRSTGLNVPPTSAPLELAVTGAWERLLGLAPLASNEDFFELGGTSMIALSLCNELQQLTGVALPPAALVHAPTIAELTRVLEAFNPFCPLVSLKSSGHGRPLFLVHGLAGDIFELHTLARRLASDRPVIGIQARGLDPHASPHRTVEAMAQDYVARVRSRQATGPYALAGYSFGGLVAFEMARILRDQGHEIEFVGLLDTDVHHSCLPPLSQASFRALRKLHRALRLAPVSLLAAARQRLMTHIERRLGATSHSTSPPPTHVAPLTLPMQRIVEQVWEAFRAYRPGPYAGPITFFQATSRPPDYCFPIPVWSAATGGRVAICEVPGDHFSMLMEPNVTALANRLGERLLAAAVA